MAIEALKVIQGHLFYFTLVVHWNWASISNRVWTNTRTHQQTTDCNTSCQR